MKFIFLVLSIVLIYGNRSLAQAPAGKSPFVLGVVDTISSQILHEKRVLNIYLPAGYSSDSVYPVIYLLDGSAVEDFIHIAGLIQFFNFPWINVLPPSIVVGIANTDRRRDFTLPTAIEKDKKDFPTTGGADNFIAFIEKELQPYIQKNYSASDSRMLIGQSLGGLLATQILLTKPSLFSQYVIVSPSLWWDNESLLSLHPSLSSPAEVFVAVGNEEETMVNDAKKLVDLLNSGTDRTMKVYFDFLPDKTHADILHQAVYDAFEKFGEK